MPRSIAYSSDEDGGRRSLLPTPHDDSERVEDRPEAEAEPENVHVQAAAPSLKVTLRTSINHLVNPSHPPSSPEAPKALPTYLRDGDSEMASSRSPSLSPSSKLTARKRVRQAASYSSDSDTEQRDEGTLPRPVFVADEGGAALSAEAAQVPSRPKKKPRKVAADDEKKKYDWLETPSEGSGQFMAGWNGDPEAQPPGTTSADPVKPKKPARRKKPEGVVGPGKNWRKGIKKGMPLPWATDDGTRPAGDYGEYDESRGTSQSLVLPRQPSISPEPSIPANAEELGFPVLRKPPITKLVPLGPIPKISAQFATTDMYNRDRKERCRTWQRAARTIFNVTGTRLKFHTWLGSPNSELAEALQREHASKLALAQAAQYDEQLLMSQNGTPSQEKGKGKGKEWALQDDQGLSPFGGPGVSEKPKGKGKGKALVSHSATPPERPPMIASNSFDSSSSAMPPFYKGSMLGPGAVEVSHGSPLRFEHPTDDIEGDAVDTTPKKRAKPRKSVPKAKPVPVKDEAEAEVEAEEHPVDVDEAISLALE